MAKVVKALVTLEVINPSDYQKLVAGNDSGAVVLFSGDVRDHHGGKQVKSLTYEAHPTAQSVLEMLQMKFARSMMLIRLP
jgi:molybdopterin synthase catalytic subunit